MNRHQPEDHLEQFKKIDYRKIPGGVPPVLAGGFQEVVPPDVTGKLEETLPKESHLEKRLQVAETTIVHTSSMITLLSYDIRDLILTLKNLAGILEIKEKASLLPEEKKEDPIEEKKVKVPKQKKAK